MSYRLLKINRRHFDAKTYASHSDIGNAQSDHRWDVASDCTCHFEVRMRKSALFHEELIINLLINGNPFILINPDAQTNKMFRLQQTRR